MKNIKISSIRVVASSFGLLAGLTGIISGLFLMQQGDYAPSTYWVSFIGPSYSMWQDSAYSVFTIIPSFYWSGALAIIVSVVSTVWSISFIHKRKGASGMFALAIIQALVGGGWVLDLGIFTCIMGSAIGTPLSWWRKRLQGNTRSTLARVWSWSLVFYGALSALLLIFTIVGVNNAKILENVLNIAGLMIIPVPFMILGGISRDIQKIELDENLTSEG